MNVHFAIYYSASGDGGECGCGLVELFVGTSANPVADGVLLSAGADGCVHVWDLAKERAHVTLAGHQDIVLAASWNTGGSRGMGRCIVVLHIYPISIPTSRVHGGLGMQGQDDAAV